ncbi:cbb3-type cytochrome c oxidase subunit I, partial [bacterium]|nr:cbb3-type cytochrome c oxidase subunit I [bacterium]
MADNQKQNYLTHPKGIMSWLLTLDHKRIGLMYLFGGIAFFFLGGVLALGMRLELAAPGNDFVSNDTYNNMYTLHGAIMIFLFIIPAIPGALGNILLPLMLGAKDVAFPRLNLASFYIYTVGALFVMYTIISGGVDTGWTFYTPYSTTSTSNVIPMTMGIFVIGFSSILTGLNFIATIHKMRIPGLTWYKLPLFVWALYGTSLVQITATPVIAITMVLLILERLLGIGIFDPALGGDPVLYQHFFWFYSHPAVYIMILPAFG